MNNAFTLRLLSFGLVLTTSQAWSQQPAIQYFRDNDKQGINVFETSKKDSIPFEDLKVRIGGAFAIQYQGLDHENADTNLVPLGSNFNLPSANLDMDVQLDDGLRMNLRIYLSSRHHEETYVKGGYLQVDKLNFIKKDFLSGLMKYTTIRIGMMEVNYGDAHFRRSDNAHTMYNPCIENYIMDAFTTEVAGEVNVNYNGWIIMGGLTNGRLNQSVTNETSNGALVGKLGYDKQMNEDFRFRLTGSVYAVQNTKGIYLYGGDRAGSRYYSVMDVVNANTNDFSGRLNPGFKTEMTSIMINPFVKFKGLEFFGLYETSSGRDDATDVTFTGNRTWTQMAGELLYRFGKKEQLYFGGRYNVASGQLPGVESDKVSIDRISANAGWFLTDNILTKLEYVTQAYHDYPMGNSLREGKFSGIMVEAVIAF